MVKTTAQFRPSPNNILQYTVHGQNYSPVQALTKQHPAIYSIWSKLQPSSGLPQTTSCNIQYMVKTTAQFRPAPNNILQYTVYGQNYSPVQACPKQHPAIYSTWSKLQPSSGPHQTTSCNIQYMVKTTAQFRPAPNNILQYTVYGQNYSPVQACPNNILQYTVHHICQINSFDGVWENKFSFFIHSIVYSSYSLDSVLILLTR